MFVRTFRTIVVSSCVVLTGCAGPADVTDTTSVDQADRISAADAPGRLFRGASGRLSDNLVAADVGRTFGVDDNHIPYPDTYWPFVDDGIDFDWTGEGSPLVKLVGLSNPNNLQAAKQWERTNHGSAVPGVQDWFGHCPGWTAAAMLNAPALHAVDVKLDGRGGLAACAPNDPSCTHFEIGDINALEAEVYVDANSAFIGARCDTAPNQIQRDQNGRIVRNGSGCKGLNAGSLLIVAGNLMKGRHQSFAIDAQNDRNTDQIWNQPAYRYTVNRFETLTEAQAANLVASGNRNGRQTTYAWNRAARGFVLADFTIHWVSEYGPNVEVISGAQSTRDMRVVAVIELDRAATDPNTTIIGGEYLDDHSVGATRLTVPPFVWMAIDAGPETLPTSVNGNHHNPYVRPSLVKQLVSLSQK